MSKVSILVPVYGVEKFIERCAVSLFEQTYPDIEYIFINDQTLDESVNVLKSTLLRYPERSSNVQIFTHEINKGLAGSRNTAVSIATGEYILHVDSDDYIETDMVELLINEAESSKADIVLCDFFFEWNSDKRIVVQNYHNDAIEFAALLLSNQAAPAVWNKLIRKSLYTQYEIKSIEGANFGEDFLVTPKLVYHANKISKVNKPLYHYMQINNNSYTKSITSSTIESMKKVISDLELFFSEKPANNKFLKALQQTKIKKRIEFITRTPSNRRLEVSTIFSDVKDSTDHWSFLTKNEKISIFLIKKEYWRFLNFYLFLYNHTQNFYTLLRRR